MHPASLSSTPSPKQSPSLFKAISSNLPHKDRTQDRFPSLSLPSLLLRIAVVVVAAADVVFSSLSALLKPPSLSLGLKTAGTFRRLFCCLRRRNCSSPRPPFVCPTNNSITERLSERERCTIYGAHSGSGREGDHNFAAIYKARLRE